ncbi:MAG TPA: hypothetical protein VFU47_14895, partial [Armatimonadota bacterium]|nr:hypothetical protein [Armatimonadota bacterium]
MAGKLSLEDTARFDERFRTEIWPLLERAEGGCVSCHNEKNPSQLHFPAEGSSASFKRLLTQGFFEPENPGSLLSRVASPLKEQRMPPPPARSWSDAEIAKLRAFVTDLYDRVHTGVRVDEQFPPELLDPYTGKAPAGGTDNTFLTYRQLRGKIKTLFEDDWVRGEKDLFQENVAQFGGADFIKRFDESSKPAAPFLSALDALSRDVASRAYLESTGPFAGRSERLPSPLALKAPDAAYRAEITRLYRRLLFRAPTEPELRQAFGFIRSIYAARESVARQEGTLDFELTARDDAGRATTHELRIRFTNEPLGVFQQFVDESAHAPQAEVKGKLDRAFTFKAGDRAQRLLLSNEGTLGNVSLAGVELKGPLPETTVKRIESSDPSVSVQGAWQRATSDGLTSFEDGNNNKGSSRIEVPLPVPKDGKYEVWLVWRRSGAGGSGRGRRFAPVDNSSAVPVEVYSHDAPLLANPPLPPVPPKGEAHFFVDQTVDTLPHWDLKTAFRFG